MRITTDNKVSEMGMVELARNSCYIGENGAARYRDYSSDVDCREMIKKMMVNFGVVESDYWADVSYEVFDDEMMENLMYGINDMQGLIALFYRNMWAMADLREKLKYFEDLEEQGLLVKLPCKIGDTVYDIRWWDNITKKVKVGGETYYKTVCKHKVSESKFSLYDYDDIGKEVFLTKEEAEKALKRMEKTNENNS
ncbi:MAG: hypothetical protein IJ272_00730 [Clostridia bacterium]|nr:hypothetical protein [Clostridia bacterium]